MKGYPKFVATREDYENLLKTEEFRVQALAELDTIANTQDATALRVISTNDDGTSVAEEIENPMPLWRVKCFQSREDVKKLAEEYREV